MSHSFKTYAAVLLSALTFSGCRKEEPAASQQPVLAEEKFRPLVGYITGKITSEFRIEQGYASGLKEDEPIRITFTVLDQRSLKEVKAVFDIPAKEQKFPGDFEYAFLRMGVSSNSRMNQEIIQLKGSFNEKGEFLVDSQQ